MKKAQSAEELKLKSSFGSIKEILSHERFAERMDYLLAFWTLPSDRRLPLSLLHYPLRKVLNSSFEELAVIPGIGQKKLASLVLLLERAIDDAPPSVPIREVPETVSSTPAVQEFRPIDENGRFDPALVSEALWQQWRETVVLHEMEDEKLGHLAPSLLELPTVIWETPLSAYVTQSLQQIRQLRTHGEKRVRVVLEVFFVIHEMLKQTGRHPRLTVRLTPSFVPPLERWFQEMLVRSSLPTLQELKDDLVHPLLDQLGLDVGGEVIQLAQGRLGLDGPAVAVRQQSRDMGVTRARVYQMLEECDRVMSVRWPEGRRLFQELQVRLERESQEPALLEFYNLAHDLFFPRNYEKLEEVLQQA